MLLIILKCSGKIPVAILCKELLTFKFFCSFFSERRYLGQAKSTTSQNRVPINTSEAPSDIEGVSEGLHF